MGSRLQERALDHLRALVAFDTQNPPRDIDGGDIFSYLREHLEPFECEQWDLGDGCIVLRATRGDPELLFNFHVDTVPAAEGWTVDPFELRIEDGRAVGLGACDIKSASACMLAALEAVDGAPEVDLLFTSDEEAGSSRCVRRFLERRPEAGGARGVVVAEPTRGRVVAEHRGIATMTGHFTGRAGHASAPRALADNALHSLVRWSERALEYAEEAEEDSYRGLRGIRFNLGTLEGGVKPNVIAPDAEVRFGCRPRPDQDLEAVTDALCDLAPDGGRVDWEPGFFAPSLPADPDSGATGRALADELGLPVGDPVDFWTEAALFSDEGLPAVVYGPGDIDRAHTADEWVAVDQLAEVSTQYVQLLEACR